MAVQAASEKVYKTLRDGLEECSLFSKDKDSEVFVMTTRNMKELIDIYFGSYYRERAAESAYEFVQKFTASTDMKQLVNDLIANTTPDELSLTHAVKIKDGVKDVRDFCENCKIKGSYTHRQYIEVGPLRVFLKKCADALMEEQLRGTQAETLLKSYGETGRREEQVDELIKLCRSRKKKVQS